MSDEVVWIFCENSADPDNSHPTTYSKFRVGNLEATFRNSGGEHSALFNIENGGYSQQIGNGLGAKVTFPNPYPYNIYVKINKVGCWFYQ